MSKSGIYKITNTANGKIYVGSAKDFPQRWGMHRYMLRRGKHHSPYMQNAYNKHGEDSFCFEVMLVCSKEDLIFYEQRALDVLCPCDPSVGYNICKVAGSSLGRKMPPHAVEAMRKRHIGNKYNLGYRHTDEAKANMSASRIGNKNAVGNQIWLGRNHSEETKARLSEVAKERRLSEETKRKISESSKGRTVWNTGKKLSEEHVEKLRQSHLGKSTAKKGTKQAPHSEETKRKISEALKAAHARRRSSVE